MKKLSQITNRCASSRVFKRKTTFLTPRYSKIFHFFHKFWKKFSINFFTLARNYPKSVALFHELNVFHEHRRFFASFRVFPQALASLRVFSEHSRANAVRKFGANAFDDADAGGKPQILRDATRSNVSQLSILLSA